MNHIKRTKCQNQLSNFLWAFQTSTFWIDQTHRKEKEKKYIKENKKRKREKIENRKGERRKIFVVPQIFDKSIMSNLFENLYSQIKLTPL